MFILILINLSSWFNLTLDRFSHLAPRYIIQYPTHTIVGRETRTPSTKGKHETVFHPNRLPNNTTNTTTTTTTTTTTGGLFALRPECKPRAPGKRYRYDITIYVYNYINNNNNNKNKQAVILQMTACYYYLFDTNFWYRGPFAPRFEQDPRPPAVQVRYAYKFLYTYINNNEQKQAVILQMTACFKYLINTNISNRGILAPGPKTRPETMQWVVQVYK